ncbi:uncharacterized protein M421DRAFT_202929 [Didymella exigua CBS 183.55]|uniref:Uncharacterized protein n=1 Tax=Didymella exigua CBS 183.55 TaxID=1150837 RepID=A0A6A5RZ17_9PLEO|nr:uncharacterized protein M421DRAFT_202929 [Didymella exigua CBS 183.55]KAF1933705.1 hypothetical protein M421DRAFT_202929 [Didymella exigua CBS 183.55]
MLRNRLTGMNAFNGRVLAPSSMPGGCVHRNVTRAGEGLPRSHKSGLSNSQGLDQPALCLSRALALSASSHVLKLKSHWTSSKCAINCVLFCSDWALVVIMLVRAFRAPSVIARNSDECSCAHKPPAGMNALQSAGGIAECLQGVRESDWIWLWSSL